MLEIIFAFLNLASNPAKKILSHWHHCSWVYSVMNRRRQWHPTPVLLPGKSHGWRSLVGCSPWGRKESDTTERLRFHFSLSCIGEGNGNPLQCSCLENPRDREPGGLPSLGSHRVGHDWSDLAAVAASPAQVLSLLKHNTFFLLLCFALLRFLSL